MALWHAFVLALQEKMIILGTVLSFAIPFTIYKINQKLHNYADPPWKRQDKGQ